MPSCYGSEDVKCPFYKQETRSAIKCEGDFAESCTYGFKNPDKKKKHKERYCNTDYKKCPHYSEVEAKYK